MIMLSIKILVIISIYFILDVFTQIEHDGSAMDVFESRWVDKTPWPNEPAERCTLSVQRYYIKKRRTRRRIQGRTLMYQFIATSVDLGIGRQDTVAHLPREPDHFALQYGWIFCDMGLMMGLEMRLHARHCGIEELLVSLCAMDTDVNPGQGINLNLNEIMPDNSDAINTLFFRNLIDENCRKSYQVNIQRRGRFDASRMRTLYGLSNVTEIFGRRWMIDNLQYYAEGIYESIHAVNVVVKQRCGNYISWRNYRIDDFRLDFDPGFVRETYVNTVGDYWYFCDTNWLLA